MNATTTKATQAQQAVLAWVSDPGHAWLVVSLDDEHGFPEAMNFASQYSYVNLMGSNFAGDVYLEEDEDAPAFIKAYGIDLSSVLSYELPDDHVVRTWPTGKTYVA
jgi:hypothetical protein